MSRNGPSCEHRVSTRDRRREDRWRYDVRELRETTGLCKRALAAALGSPASGIAAIAISLGTSASMVMALLVLGQLAVAAVSFIVMNRRH